jgi:hypothetical protein
MTGSRETLDGGFVGRSVKDAPFQDVCTTRGKWFHATSELFRRVARDETFEDEKRAI